MSLVLAFVDSVHSTSLPGGISRTLARGDGLVLFVMEVMPFLLGRRTSRLHLPFLCITLVVPLDSIFEFVAFKSCIDLFVVSLFTGPFACFLDLCRNLFIQNQRLRCNAY